MTEAERRAEEERRQQRWVELRAACTVQGTFDEIADAIKSDIGRFMNLNEKKRRGRLFKDTRPDDASLFVGEIGNNGKWIDPPNNVTVKASTTGIIVLRNKDCTFEIAHEWNEETLACDLKIGGKCYSIWQISQKAIGDLLFGL